MHDHVGLFDTPPNRGENRFALVVAGVMGVVFCVVLPVLHEPIGEIPAFIPACSAILFVGDLIIASLLYAQAKVFRSGALTLLASSFVFTGLIVVPYALTFPGVFSPGGLLSAGLSTTAWLMIFRQWAAPLSAILYMLLKEVDAKRSAEARRDPPVFASAATAVGLVIAATLLTTIGHDLLPAMFVNRSEALHRHLFVFNMSMIILVAAAMGLLLWRRRSVLDTWLLVSLGLTMITSLLNVPMVARFTLGWYCLWLLILFSHIFVLLALIAEGNRLYVKLALATAGRSRERDARLASMNGVAAAISHEIGQPLVAVSLSASAALNALTRPRPDAEKAVSLLRDTLDANRRAFAVVESIRAMFGRKSSPLSEFDLNDLLRESVGLLHREMVAQRITLRFALGEALPLILANRVQIQQVLVNLLTNAMEAIAAGGSRGRRIVVRSSTPDDEIVRVEISDSGSGIAPEALSRIFDPFFTTKSSGTGLGLSLSRTVLEDHGGRLWASPAEGGGSTFSLELRRAPGRESEVGTRTEP